jgi:RNA polymerase sigma factor FliA
VTPDARALQERIDREVAALTAQARSEAWKAFQRAPHALELDELEAQALFGLAQAARRWPVYCQERGHDPWAFNYFWAFCLRRMRGAMLDAMRALDWVTRSERGRAKQIRAASQSAPMTEDDLVTATGFSAEEIRSTMAMVAARPVSMDAEPYDFADDAENVESSAMVGAALSAAAKVIGELPAQHQEILVLRYYYGKSVSDAAAIVGVGVSYAQEAHLHGVGAVHSALLAAVS